MQIKSKEYAWITHPAFIFSLYGLIILLVRVFLRSQMLEWDEAEQVVVAQQFSLGYPAQPPLYSWFQFYFFKLFGNQVFSLAFFKSILIFGCLYVYHQICRLHCQSLVLAWCATLSWTLVPMILLGVIMDDTHSILAVLVASLTWYWFVSPRKLDTRWYLILGSLIGLGILAKYNYAFFLISLLITSLSLPEYRKILINRKMLLALFLSFLFVSPYLYWLRENYSFGFNTAYKLGIQDKLQFWHVVSLVLVASIKFILPFFIFAYLIFPIKFKFTQAKAANALLVRYHLLCLPFLILVIYFAGVSLFITRWLMPILFLCPVLYFSQVKDEAFLEKRVKFFFAFCFLLQPFLFIGPVIRSYQHHEMKEQSTIVQTIKNQHEVTALIVSDKRLLLGNLMLAFPKAEGWLLGSPKVQTLPKGKSLLVWEGAIPPIWLNLFAKPEMMTSIKTIENSKDHKILAGYLYINQP